MWAAANQVAMGKAASGVHQLKGSPGLEEREMKVTMVGESRAELASSQVPHSRCPPGQGDDCELWFWSPEFGAWSRLCH